RMTQKFEADSPTFVLIRSHKFFRSKCSRAALGISKTILPAASTIFQARSRQRPADTEHQRCQTLLAATTTCSTTPPDSTSTLPPQDIHRQAKLLPPDSYASSRSKPSSCLQPSRPLQGQTAATRWISANAFPSHAGNVQ